MMAAVQPFISGAISKTINLTNEASLEDIKDCYYLSWELGLKACALYRDGSKLSQPLSNKSDKKAKKTEEESEEKEIFDLKSADMNELLEEINQRMMDSPDTTLKRQLSKIVERKQLPAKRKGFTYKGKVGGQPVFLRTGEYRDGTLGEIFIDIAKEGATVRSLMNCFAISISIGLQHGVPLEEFVDKFIFTRFEPAGMVDHPNIKSSTSIVDYIFRVLGYEYLDRNDLVHVVDDEKVTTQSMSGIMVKPSQVPSATEKLVPQQIMATENTSTLDTTKKLMGTSSDAPACKQCGNITLRNGTCYMCPNCGTTTGCS